jgi:hypothetical protein
MKANKALRRLSKIESLMLDVTQRFSGPVALQRVLHDAIAAVTQAKDTMSKKVSSGMATKANVKHPGPKKAEETKSTPARKLADKRAAVKHSVPAKAANKVVPVPVKKTVNKAAKNPISAPAKAVTEAAG